MTGNTNLEGFFGSNGYYRGQDGAVTYAEDLSIAAGVPVRYEAQGGTFTVTSVQYLIPDQASTGPVGLSRDNSMSTFSFSEYRAQSGGVTYRFTQLAPGSANPLLPLSYASVGVARASFFDTAAGVTKYGITPMAFGILFDWDRTVLTGSAEYAGVALGHARGQGSRVYEVSGTVQVSLNYDTRAFSGRLRLTGKDDVTGETVDLGSFDLVQDQPRPVLDYFYASSSTNGRLQARLAGSLGEEFMGGFDTNVPDPRTPGATLKVVVALAAKK